MSTVFPYPSRAPFAAWNPRSILHHNSHSFLLSLFEDSFCVLFRQLPLSLNPLGTSIPKYNDLPSRASIKRLRSLPETAKLR
ncbi:unnamed protein product [Periconia digitata]|uniref:Uncharacterized protein n=1 Tax=Periconia digitata TaxID=1303443 RepID=A0A9W4TZA0_9PLEO|nr:unnamed protein product [Periconia digitata]